MVTMIPMIISAKPPRSASRSRPAAGSFTCISAMSCLNCSTRSGCSIIVVSLLVSPRLAAEVRLRQFVLQLARGADPRHLAVHEHRGEVGDPEHGARELLDHEDRHAVACDLGDQLVELLDDDGR